MPSNSDTRETLPSANIVRLPAPIRPPFSQFPPRLAIIGAGSRGNAFGKAISESSNGICVAVAEPNALKRKQFGRKYIWGEANPCDGQEFNSWEDLLAWEKLRRSKVEAYDKTTPGYDGIFICVQDAMHRDVILAFAPLGIHIMCEKPLATTLEDCVAIYKALKPENGTAPRQLFSIGHVLRYSPHNMLLRHLLLKDRVIGDITFVNHTEPVGWWHFAHSFVR
jgi:predicted dehydrogenase